MSDEAQLDSVAVEAPSDVSAPADSAPESTPAPSAPEESVWSSFRALPDFKGYDDSQIAGRLYASLEREKAATKALQQYQQLIPYAQEYLTHREPFERWMTEQQRAQHQAQQPQQPQAQQPEQPAWWSPPELTSSDKRYLVRDEHGRETVAENAPLHVRERIRDYLEYKAEFAQKFLANPKEALGPMVEQVASERAREIVEQQIREVTEANYVNNLESQNKDWLYEADGRTPSREGLMIQKYIQDAAARGYATPNDRWQYACDMVERDLLREVLESQQSRAAAPQALVAPRQAPQSAPASQPPAQNRAERDIEYLRREASRNPSRSGPPSDPRIPKAPMTFEQRLRAQMARDGID